MWMMDTQSGTHTHILGLMYLSEVRSEEGVYNRNDERYGLKAQIERHSGVFV